MKTILDLSGTLSPVPFVEARGHVASVHAEITAGSFLTVGLGPAGLMIHRGEVGCGIRLIDLVELAGRLDPEIAALIVPAQPDEVNPT